MHILFGLLASWGVLAALMILVIGAIVGPDTLLSSSGVTSKRQPMYAAPTRVRAELHIRPSMDNDADAHAPPVAKLRLKASDQELRQSRKTRSHARDVASSRDGTSRGTAAASADRHSSNF